MRRYKKIETQSIKGARKYKWAIRMFVIAICMSLLFGFISQTLLTNMGVIVASICICIFIFFAVFFDMLGVAVASTDIKVFEKWVKEGVKGAGIGLKLSNNAEKMCSFCGDVVSDICSTLCGAGGACIVATLTTNFANKNAIMLISISVSAIIAGITIFFKAIIKEKAIKNSNKIILKLSCILENTIFKEKEEKVKK